MNKIINKYKLILLFVFLLVLDGLFFGFTDPSQISQVFLLFGFVLAGLTTYVIMVLILRYLKYISYYKTTACEKPLFLIHFCF